MTSANPLGPLVTLLGPAPPGPPAVLAPAGPGWSYDDARLASSPVVLWGRPALPAGTGAAPALRFALERERAVRALRRRPPAGVRVGAVHRIEPPVLQPGLRGRVRSALLRGLLVECASGRTWPRVVDDVLAAADVTGQAAHFRVGSGGTLLVRVARRGRAALLRVAPAGSPGDPGPAAGALLTLAGTPLVPELLDRGAAAGASWSLEALLTGNRPRGLPDPLLDEVARFCAQLPRTPAPPSVASDVALIASVLPRHAGPLPALVERLESALSALPGIARHGDLWSGNLLVRGGRLSGVLDWDGWTASAVPGTDLLHLLATERRLARRCSLGAVFLERPWTWPAFAQAGRSYWGALGVAPTPAQLEAVGWSWWAAQVSGDLRRTPQLARDEDWVAENVERVVTRAGA